MFKFIAVLFLTLAFAAPAHAEAPLPREQVEELARHVHANLAHAKIGKGEGELIGEERAKTLVYPLVPYELIEFVVVRGHLAGFAAHCGLDWQNKFYAPLMRGLRAKQTDYNDYQWAFVGMLHGASMGGAERSVKDEPCDDKMKENLSKAALVKD